MEQGPVEQNIIKQSLKAGQPIPEKIRNAPTLGKGLEIFYNAFIELNSCRSIGMDMGEIPWVAIAKYAEVHEFEGEQRDDLFYFAQALDSAYISYRQSRSKNG